MVTTLQVAHTSVRRIWYADDSGAAGQLVCLRRWWDDLQVQAEQYGYNTNPDKTLLFVKPEMEEEVYRIFSGTGIRIVTGAAKYLGFFVGESGAVADGVRQRLSQWTKEVNQLADVAKTEPHAASVAVAHGLLGEMDESPSRRAISRWLPNRF